MMTGMFLVAGSPLILAATSVAVHAGHHDVEQDQVGRLLRDHGERFLAAGGGQEQKALRREHDFQQLSVVAFIVHDQNAGGCPACRPTRTSMVDVSAMLTAVIWR